VTHVSYSNVVDGRGEGRHTFSWECDCELPCRLRRISVTCLVESVEGVTDRLWWASYL